jgi:hypothetical protein
MWPKRLKRERRDLQPRSPIVRSLATLPLQGRTKAVLMAHGFTIEMLEELISSGNAKAEAHTTTSGGRPVVVVWLQITAAGRKLIAEGAP